MLQIWVGDESLGLCGLNFQSPVQSLEVLELQESIRDGLFS